MDVTLNDCHSCYVSAVIIAHMMEECFAEDSHLGLFDGNGHASFFLPLAHVMTHRINSGLPPRGQPPLGV